MYFDRISRRCRSPITTTWSRHSRRIEPITRSAYAFCHGERGANHRLPDLQRLGLARKALSIDLVAVPDQIAGRFLQPARLKQLESRPFRSRMLRDIEMHQPAPAVGQHHQHE